MREPDHDWRAHVRSAAKRELTALEATRFGDLAGAIGPALAERIDRLSGPFVPVLGHIDCSIENVVIDESGGIAGLLDWAFSLAVTPAYDLYYADRSLRGGHWAYVPDLGPTVREGLVEGYRRGGRRQTIDAYLANRGCYELLATVRAMNLFEGWFEGRNVEPDRIEGAASALRPEARSLIDGRSSGSP